MEFPNISRVAFEIFGLEVHWYSLAYILSFFISFYFIKYLLKKSTNSTMSYTNLDDLFTYMILGIVIGGRLGYVMFYNLSFYVSNPLDIFKVWNGGMSFHGGLLGSITALYYWCKKNHKSFLYLSDILTLCAPIGLFFGRIANFINGELYGRVTTAIVGIVFPSSGGTPRHPSQLYEAFGEGLVLFIILLFLREIKGVRKRYGVLSFSFLGLYAIARIVVENYREPDEHIGLLMSGLTMGQLLTLPMLIVSIGSIIYLFKKKSATEEFVSSPLLNNTKSVINRFFTRNNGVSEGVFESANCKYESSDLQSNVSKNREILLSTIGLDAKTSLITLNQSHTNKIVVIDKPISPEKLLKVEADGLITTLPNIALGILTADCVPLLLIDTKKNIIGAIHCGWQGIHKDIIKTTAQKFKELGSDIKDIKVALGPCLKQESYEVDEDFRDNIIAQNKKFKRLFECKGRNIISNLLIPRGKLVMAKFATSLLNKDKYLFDCTKYCVMKLKQEGIKNIDIIGLDTYQDEELFFSYRGIVRKNIINVDNQVDPMDSGRQLSVITIKK